MYKKRAHLSARPLFILFFNYNICGFSVHKRNQKGRFDFNLPSDFSGAYRNGFKIKNRFVLSFLHYIPYAVLSVMTVPAIFHATGDRLSATAGFVVAVLLSFWNRSLLTVAAAACVAVLLAELML